MPTKIMGITVKAMTLYVHTGHLFPLDMLRYDTAFVKRGDLVIDQLDGQVRGDGINVLYVRTTQRNGEPTHGRWDSFGSHLTFDHEYKEDNLSEVINENWVTLKSEPLRFAALTDPMDELAKPDMVGPYYVHRLADYLRMKVVRR